MPRQLMTKIVFLLKWWCWSVVAWIGALLFVLHWDGNVESVFKTELWLIMWWPHTETFCLASETKWPCQPGCVTACLCLCMKHYWVSSGYSWDTVTSEIVWNTINVSGYGTQGLLGSGMLYSVYYWGHTNIKMLMKHLFQNTPSILSSLLCSLLLSQFSGMDSWAAQERGTAMIWYLGCINKHRNISLKNQYFSNLTAEQIVDLLFF